MRNSRTPTEVPVDAIAAPHAIGRIDFLDLLRLAPAPRLSPVSCPVAPNQAKYTDEVPELSIENLKKAWEGAGQVSFDSSG
jgi:hypothetical protein